MKRVIQRLVSLGVDLSTRKALKNALKILGIKPENIDKLYIELRNDMNREAFSALPAKQKVVFIPQCLRKSKKCRARLSPVGYICKGCSRNCKARLIKEKSEKLGYKVHIVPGGSMVFNIINRFRPRAALGIGCLKELTLAAENIRIPGCGIELLRDGCVDTDVNLEEVSDILNGNSKAYKLKGE